MSARSADKQSMTNSLTVSSSVADSRKIVLDGEVWQPSDDADDPAFRAVFRSSVLDGVCAFLTRREPWGLWIGAVGEFERFGSVCEITALRLGWTTWDREQLEIVADVVNPSAPDSVIANENQPLCYLSEDEANELSSALSLLRDSER